jgi:hypothetical protein
MSNTVRWSTLSLLLIAALVCYLLGFHNSSGILVIAGVFFEGCFWFKFLTSPKGKALL